MELDVGKKTRQGLWQARPLHLAEDGEVDESDGGTANDDEAHDEEHALEAEEDQGEPDEFSDMGASNDDEVYEAYAT